MKFLADAMLGKLTRWLRILGQDVVYSIEFNDSELLDLVKKEKRVLLTKDFELYKRAISKGLDSYNVEGMTESEHLASIAKRYNLDLSVNMDNSHCPLCNAKLVSIPKEQLKLELETNTFAYYNKFWKCPNCGQIYWQGGHWTQINNTLNQAKTKLKKLKENNGD